jgi:hypothetical protein
MPDFVLYLHNKQSIDYDDEELKELFIVPFTVRMFADIMRKSTIG